MAKHIAYQDAKGKSRVTVGVDMTALGTSTSGSGNGQGGLWVTGADYSQSVAAGALGQKSIEKAIDSSGSKFPDPYGTARMSRLWRWARPSPESPGIASNASIVDVRVLDALGQGHISDALAGIDWVLLHARDYNIKALNVSLAADSTESYITDPMCRAVRSAVAAGITVVVAAGNYGVDAVGREMYGTIGSPGNEPAAITVGSANMHGGILRGAATVNHFSSRGPTMGGFVDSLGVRQADDVLEPELIAPGNRILGALSTDDSGKLISTIGARYPQQP